MGVTQYEMKVYKAALELHQHAVQIRLKLFGENHPDTAESYYSIGVTQHAMKDYKAAHESKQQGVAAQSHDKIGVTENVIKKYETAVESHRHALQIRLKLFNLENVILTELKDITALEWKTWDEILKGIKIYDL